MHIYRISYYISPFYRTSNTNSNLYFFSFFFFLLENRCKVLLFFLRVFVYFLQNICRCCYPFIAFTNHYTNLCLYVFYVCMFAYVYVYIEYILKRIQCFNINLNNCYYSPESQSREQSACHNLTTLHINDIKTKIISNFYCFLSHFRLFHTYVYRLQFFFWFFLKY